VTVLALSPMPFLVAPVTTVGDSRPRI